jgi:arsenite/tail-anchored protein-transporting ATPase
VRTLLLTGPGGAGTTTLACSAAVRAARSGLRTVLLTRRAPDVAGLDAVAGLEVTVVDARRALEQLWGATADAVAELVPALTVPPSASVVPLPGTGDIALLAALARADADLVVLDAGPVDDALALIGLPATLRWWLDQLLPPGVRALGAVRTAAVTHGTAKRGPVDAALALVPVVEELLSSERLADPAATVVSLVAPPRPAAGAAVRAAATTLALHGLRVGGVLTRVLPGGGPGQWWVQRAAAQNEAVAAFAPVAPVHRVPERAAAPADADAVAGLLEGWELPATGGSPTPAPERRDDGWSLTLPLPFAERSAVDLIRWSDDLVLTVAGVRRSVRLDSLLRRCEVTGARLHDPGTAGAALEVTFRPDPRLWPADLLAAEERTP